MSARWPNGRRFLTTNQEHVFRTVFIEEIESGATPAAAYREAEQFMCVDALPDWQRFWKDWNTPHPLAPFFAAVNGLALISIMVAHAEKIGGVFEQTAATLRHVIGGDAK